ALDIVASAANLDSHKAKTIVERLSFLKFDPRTGNLEYISDAYKGFVADRLASMREESEEVLIEHYLRSPHEKASLIVLPTYLASQQRYERLRNLVTTDFLVRSLSTGRDVSLLRRMLKIAAAQAAESEDLVGSYRFALAGSILRTVSTEPVAEGEIEALLELSDFEQAYDIAYQAVLPEDR